MKREELDIKAYIEEELKATSSINENGSLILVGTIHKAVEGIRKLMGQYISQYVICKQCKSSNTELKKENKIRYLCCNQCLSKMAT